MKGGLQKLEFKGKGLVSLQCRPSLNDGRTILWITVGPYNHCLTPVYNSYKTRDYPVFSYFI